MDNIYKAVQLTIDSQNLALSKKPTHVYIANQYVDTNDTPLITAPFIIQKALENGTGVVDIVSSTIGSIYEVRLLCDAEVLISGYFYMPPMNAKFSELELYTSYPPRTPPVINEFWQKTENFILEKTNTLLNFVQVFNSLSSMRLSLGCLEELLTTKKSNLVSAINEVVSVKANKADVYTKPEIDTNYGGVKTLYDKNVVAGAGENGWVATFIADASGMTQQQVNDKTAIFYNSVADMVADTKLKAGKAVITHGYYTPNDGGGARYLIKDTPTDYSIPVANNLHAVFADTFDIRKFGIQNNIELNQDENLLRMRNYADSRVYTIDFLNYKIMTPKLNPSIKNRSYVRGLWFEYAHHYKNLFIAHDKTRRLNFGDNLLIFCPSIDPKQVQNVVYENITMDCWSDNRQAFTDNYIGFYDGCCHGIFIHPKNDWGALKPYLNAKKTSNYNFEFKNIHFASSSYSYNITQAGVRANTVKATNITGDCIVGINLDTCNFNADLVRMNVRRDLIESGRLMVQDVIHYEPEATGQIDAGIIYELDSIVLNRCSATRNGDQVGQLLWVSPTSIIKVGEVKVTRSSGVVELCGGTTGVSEFDSVLIEDCLKDFWLNVYGRNDTSRTKFNSIVQRRVSNKRITGNTLYPSSMIKTDINSYIYESCELFDGNGVTESFVLSPTIKLLMLKDCELMTSSQVGKFNHIICDELVIDNLKNPQTPSDTAPFRFLRTPKVTVKNSTLKNVFNMQFNYADAAGFTNLTYDNVKFEQGGLYAEISGFVDFINCEFNGTTLPNTSLGLASWNGTRTLESSFSKNTAKQLFKQQYTLNAVAIPANGKYYATYSVNAIAKYFDVSLLNAESAILTKWSRSGNSLIVCFENTTASAITLTNTVIVRQFN